MIVELLSLLLIILVERVKAILFPKLQDRVMLIDLLGVLLFCSIHEKGIILFAYICVTFFFDILRVSKDLLIDMAEACVYNVYKKMQKLILNDVLQTLDEYHKNS